MSQSQDGSESSGYCTSASASSEYGSLDEHFKFPMVIPRGASKRKACENVEELDEMLKKTLMLSPEKRVRLISQSNNSQNNKEFACHEGRPPTRRSSSSDMEMSPRVRSLRAVTSGSTIDIVRTVNAVSSDSISPKFLKQYSSPKKRINLNENVYSKHRLGNAFSPLVVGARRKVCTPSSHGFKTPGDRQSSLDSPKRSGLRRTGAFRVKRPLGDRLRFDALD
uniref:Uncharacterized protein n=1 Tax=Caenorhabditis japonica TaxID=281687 RepID=A0A8R1IU13_CAEJA